MDRELFQEILEAAKRDESRVLATVASTRGSTPRKAGATLLLRPDGTFTGTIGGGCGEGDVLRDAVKTMADGHPRLVTVDLTEPTDGDDKICGGVMEVFVERIVSSTRGELSDPVVGGSCERSAASATTAVNSCERSTPAVVQAAGSCERSAAPAPPAVTVGTACDRH